MTARQWFRTVYEVVIRDLWVVWLCFLVPVAVFYVIAFLPSHATVTTKLVWTGATLQLFGVGSVAWNLHERRRALDQPPLTQWFRAWAVKARSLVWRGTSQTVHVTGVGAVAAAGRATARGLAVDRSSMESRVAALEQRADWLEEDVRAKTAELHTRVTQLSTELRAENTKHQTEIGDLRQRVSTLLIGGAGLEFAGLAWIVFGQILTAWPGELTPFATWLIPFGGFGAH